MISSPSYNIEDWKKGYQSQPQEYDYWVEDIEGEIPPELNGTLFRNGPGLLDIHGTPIRHPFDGDGMVCAISFREGRVHFRNRFVRTEAFVQEQEAGKILYRGVFGTQKPGGWLNNAFDFRLKNIANTNIIYWGGKLLALWEAAEPYGLDPRSLDTLGLDYLDGVLAPGDAFSAHPRIDPSSVLDETGDPCLVNFSVKPGLSTKITIYEFNLDGKLLRRHSHMIPGFAFIHDFAITPNYCIFFQNPVRFNPLPFALGFRGAGECVHFLANRPTQVIVIPRSVSSKSPQTKLSPQTPLNKGGFNKMKTLKVESGFVFHHANAFESGDEIYVDSVCYESLTQIDPDMNYKEVDFSTLAPGQLWRFKLNLKDNLVEKEMLNSRSCEFPVVNQSNVGRNYRYLFIGATHYPTGNAPPQAIEKLDLASGEGQLCSFAPQGFVSEPIFVPHPEATREDEGWVLSLVYDSEYHRSDVVILDGRDLNRGAMATIHLQHHIPYGLHGSWTPECFV